MYKYQQTQKSLSFPDEKISKRVLIRIKKLNKMSAELVEMEEALPLLENQLQELTAGTHAHKRKTSELGTLTQAIQDAKQDIDDLDNKINSDIGRLHNNRDAYDKNAQNLAANRGGGRGHAKPANNTEAAPVVVAAVATAETTAEPAIPPVATPPPAAEPPKAASTTPPKQTPPTPVKKSNGSGVAGAILATFAFVGCLLLGRNLNK